MSLPAISTRWFLLQTSALGREEGENGMLRDDDDDVDDDDGGGNDNDCFLLAMSPSNVSLSNIFSAVFSLILPGATP